MKHRGAFQDRKHPFDQVDAFANVLSLVLPFVRGAIFPKGMEVRQK